MLLVLTKTWSYVETSPSLPMPKKLWSKNTDFWDFSTFSSKIRAVTPLYWLRNSWTLYKMPQTWSYVEISPSLVEHKKLLSKNTDFRHFLTFSISRKIRPDRKFSRSNSKSGNKITSDKVPCDHESANMGGSRKKSRFFTFSGSISRQSRPDTEF